MRYLCSCSFDGLLFFGSSKQPSVRTVCGTLETCISKILNNETNITPCSRTDKGVHANIFYFHFDTLKELNENSFTHSLECLTPEDIHIINTEKVNDEFHARYSVVSKEYLYIINTGEYSVTRRNYQFEYNTPIDMTLLQNAKNLLEGTHDFKSFTSDNEKTNYIRTINYIKIEKESTLIKIYINADGFLKYMVRNIIGLFLELNEGKKTIEDIPKILESKDRRELGIKASPCGLYLNKVNYGTNNPQKME